ncbi:hypothetical protein D3C87_1776290 [compost metagenome]
MNGKRTNVSFPKSRNRCLESDVQDRRDGKRSLVVEIHQTYLHTMKVVCNIHDANLKSIDLFSAIVESYLQAIDISEGTDVRNEGRL